jgi:hypothetical protein
MMALWWSAASADVSAKGLVLRSILSTPGIQMASPLYESVHAASDAQA